METAFHVQTETFQGPLELLLDLVEKRKLFVNEISLARVADDFVRYVENNPRLPLAQTAQFIVVASTLLLIKSRSLLPGIELTKDEETDIKDLEEKLRLYAKIREGASVLQKNLLKRPLLKSRRAQPTTVTFVAPTDLNFNSVYSAMRSMINEFPAFVRKPEVHVGTTISLPEMIQTLTERIKREVRTRFSSVANMGEKGDVIVSFLALLELVRQGTVSVNQERKFADIEIERDGVGVPSY